MKKIIFKWAAFVLVIMAVFSIFTLMLANIITNTVVFVTVIDTLLFLCVLIFIISQNKANENENKSTLFYFGTITIGAFLVAIVSQVLYIVILKLFDLLNTNSKILIPSIYLDITQSILYAGVLVAFIALLKLFLSKTGHTFSLNKKINILIVVLCIFGGLVNMLYRASISGPNVNSISNNLIEFHNQILFIMLYYKFFALSVLGCILTIKLQKN